MEIPQALLDFVNMKDFSLSDMKKFYAKHLIKHNFNYGGFSVCLINSRGEEFFFYTLPELKQIMPNIKWDLITKTPKSNINSIFPDNTESRYAGASTRCLSDILKIFLDKCINGYLDITFLNNEIPREALQVELRQTKNIWKPCVSLVKVDDTYLDLREFIVDSQILAYILRGDGEIFSRVRKCQSCSKYFIPASLKKKFCSDKCRAAYHYAIEH